MAERRKFDLIPGTNQDNLIIGVVLACGVYITMQGGKAEAWREAVSTGGPAVAALYYGKKHEEAVKEEAKKQGWEEGFNTLNPRLRTEEVVGNIASTIGVTVAKQAAGQMIERAAESWFQDPEPEKEARRGRRERRER